MQSTKLRFILILFITTLISHASFAQSKTTVGAMVLLGTGKMGNTTDVMSRSMMYTPVALFVGYNLAKFRMGLNYEYNLAGQTDDPATFSNQNMGGKGSIVGLRLDYYNGKQSIGLIYHVSEKYNLDKPTIAGTVAGYDGKSGFGFQYYRQFKNKIGVVFDYTTASLKSSAANSNDINMDRISLGLVFTNFAK